MNAIYRIFYSIKPFVPRSLQIWVRRHRAHRLRAKFSAHWPIDYNTAAKPALFPGWPQGKRFALVLTHDVETAKGYQRCRALMRLDLKEGFTASFNFVPDRYPNGYQVEGSLIQEIKDKGFEIGVHGLKHDGREFISDRIFRERAARINFYMKSWGAVGFYSPSMNPDLEKISKLNIIYDQSTFDTDPFEPRQACVCTIFPFHVLPSTAGKGYVELPYTLPQDHTLFAILQETDITVWKTKLAWIVQNGGMALLTTHPDYMNFGDSGKVGLDEYPVSHYIDFLRHIKKKYSGQYWHVLPKQLAEYWCREVPRGVHSQSSYS